MSQHNFKEDWESYKKTELARIDAIVIERGYTLDVEQPHTLGERFLMQAVTTESGHKLILLGRRLHDNKRVIIKGTSDEAGKAELQHEATCRNMLDRIGFSYQQFAAPQPIEVIDSAGLLVTIHEYIEQSSPFLERSIEEQFTFALNAFKAQESAHATTHRHYTEVAEVFGVKQATDYKTACATFVAQTRQSELKEYANHLKEVCDELSNHQDRIEQYCGFLTHTDFVPHNFRIRDGVMYLLDFSSLRFANKHESWARFMNFMALYHPALNDALYTYLKANRAREEIESLQLMRLYRLAEIIHYYIDKYECSTDSLKTLNRARVDFWIAVLKAQKRHEPVNENIRLKYQATRDSLRSPEEKKRQIGLH